MKKSGSIFMISCLFLFGCEASESSSTLQLASQIETAVGKTASIYSPVGDIGFLIITIASIEDSRCPANALCIWEGDANVEFLVGALTFKLSISQSQHFMKNNGHFVLTLLDVIPYPGLGTNSKTAVYIVNRM